MPVSVALHPAVARALDALLPPALRGGAASRARVLAACFVVTMGVGLGFPLYRWATGTTIVSLLPLAAAGASGLACWLCLWRCAAEITTIGRGYFVAMALLLPAHVAFGDGTGAFALSAVAAVPICALYVVGIREGLAVAVTVTGVTLAMAVASLFGFELPPIRSERNTVLLGVLAALSATWTTFLVAWTYETAARATIQALAASEHRSELALRAARGGVVEVRGDGTVWLSPLAGELVGRPPETGPLTREGLLAQLGLEDGARLALALTSAAGGAAHTHVATRRPGVPEGWLAWDAAAERDAEGGSRVVLVVRDVTDERRLATMKEDLVANVSHELRTPITTVQGAIGLLRAGAVGPLPASADPLLVLASRSTRRLAGLVDDLLDVRRLDTGALVVEVAPLAPAELAGAVVEGARATADSAGVRMELHSTLPDAALLRSDGRRVAQVLGHLVDNAIKFSPPGGTVQVGIAPGERNGVRFEVHDEGPGIPEWFRPWVFERFAQVGSGPARPHGGAGLGLNLASQVCAHLGGTIGFQARTPRGTTFWFELPERDE